MFFTWFQASAEASSGYSLPTFRDKLSVPSLRVKGIEWDNLSVPPSGVKPLKMGPKVCPEKSVINKHCSLRNKLEECISRGMCLCQNAFRGKKVKSLSALWRHIGAVEIYLHLLLTALDGSEGSTSGPDHFTTVTHGILGAWGGVVFKALRF